jgi:DNA helicase-2/ATP-dependent DNA helicase PcrA
MISRAGRPDTTADRVLRDLLDRPDPGGFGMVAGAGSGKTTSLVKALTHVVSSRGAELRRRTQKVACITYTEVAAKEIHEDAGGDPLIFVATIHSFLWSVVKPFQREIAAWVRQRAEAKLAELEAKQAGFSSRVQQGTREKTANDIARLRDQLARLQKVQRFTYGAGSDYGKGVLGHEDIINIGPQLIMERPLLARLVARQYPFILVDESQDTFPAVVNCFKHVAQEVGSAFCLGFFGDPMQQIYVRGVGTIELPDGWPEIEKPENFRSPRRVLEVMNRIREAGDGLEQVPGLSASDLREGSVSYFVLPADNARTETLELVRTWLDGASAPGSWTTDDPVSGAKILVVAHRMAARRLGFENLYAAFHDSGSGSLSQAFDEGTAWPITPFLNVLLPLADAQGSQVVGLLRKYSPALNDEGLRERKAADVLTELRRHVQALGEVVRQGGAGSVGRALDVAIAGKLLELDPRLTAFQGSSSTSDNLVLSESTLTALGSFMQCDVHELRGYQRYFKEESPYSTHQGVKGAEFPRVLVVLDDEEGRHFQFSYDKLLGVKALSKTDLENQSSGKDSVVDRTRRLFYVCCSRSTEALAIVLYAHDVSAAVRAIRDSGLPGGETVLTLPELDRAMSEEIT